jgi:hypothetical protein
MGFVGGVMMKTNNSQGLIYIIVIVAAAAGVVLLWPLVLGIAVTALPSLLLLVVFALLMEMIDMTR